MSAMKKGQRVLVSQCLLGINCRYNAVPVRDERICEAASEYGFIPVCPEVLGGLPTPRPACERCGEGVHNKEGQDVTQAFFRGAEQTLEIAKMYGAKYALLKERSPSCGHGVIYDGTFTGKRIAGNGMTAQMLEENGIKIFGESELDALLALLNEKSLSKLS